MEGGQETWLCGRAAETDVRTQTMKLESLGLKLIRWLQIAEAKWDDVEA
jgi:hypothetical protein